MELSGIEVDVRETGMLQRPLQEGFDLLIEPLSDSAHLRSRYVGVTQEDTALRWHEQTKAYAARRMEEGRSKAEFLRCL